MAETSREGWQMEGASTQRRWHYIEGNTSICGRFGFYFGEVGPPLQSGNPGSDCAECVRRVERKIAKAESAGREFAQCSTCQGGPVCYCTDTGFPTSPQPNEQEQSR